MTDENISASDRRQPLSDADIERIAVAVARKASQAFHIEEEKHYNDHHKLDKMLEVYENAQSSFWKAFIAIVIVGALFLAGLGIAKGVK